MFSQLTADFFGTMCVLIYKNEYNNTKLLKSLTRYFYKTFFSFTSQITSIGLENNGIVINLLFHF